ncbi:MAG TPA: hypothetical protein VFT54_07910 [Acidimicrobiia bacterium]|nr:hypothetical protein [Acidimicrobiia bacterium]
MQTPNMPRAAPNWKVLAGVAAASALGISGWALADTKAVSNPPPINLADSETPVDATRVTIEEDLGFGALNDELDSPLDPEDTGNDVASITGDTPAGLDTLSGDTSDDAAAAEVHDDDSDESSAG